MSGSASEFSRLLTEAIRLIKSREAKSISAIQDELGYAIGRTGSTIEHWRKGNLPARDEQTAELVTALATRVTLPQSWYRRLLATAGYPAPDTLLTQVVATHEEEPPAVAEPHRHTSIENTTSLPQGKSSEVLEWPLLPPEQPPLVTNFIGRQALLIALKEQLSTEHFAVITGMPGVGKSTLGAALVQWLQWPMEKLFWYTFRGKEGLGDIVWRLADFLAWHQVQDFHRILRTSNPPPMTVLLDALLHAMRNQGYLLCFDDIQFLTDVTATEHLLRSFEARATQAEVSILLISRTAPKLTRLVKMEVVNGLNQEESAGFLEQQGRLLPEKQLTALHLLTQGNPQLLHFISDMLQHGGEPTALLTTIIRSAPVENYLLREVDEHITDEERAVMEAIAVLGSDGESAEAIEAVAAIGRVKQCLTNLTARHLLITRHGEHEQRYNQHAMVQSFYYDLLSRSERRIFHRRAVAFYTQERWEPLRAAYHCEQADDYQQAVDIVTTLQLSQLLNQRQLEIAGQLLEALANKYGHGWQETQAWIKICIMRGHLYRLQGIYQKTLTMFECALQATSVVTDRARLLTELGATYYAGGKFEQAKEAYYSGLTLYETLDDQSGLAEGYNGLGWACCRLGEISDARRYFDTSCVHAETLPYPYILARAEQGLAIVEWREGHLDAAKQRCEASQQRFHQLGEYWREAEVISNLGLIYSAHDDHESARREWERAIEMLDRVGNINSLITTYCNLGGSYHDTGDFRIAITYYMTAWQLVQNTDDILLQSYTSARLADSYLPLHDLAQAITYAQQAYDLAKINGFKNELGLSARVLADIHAARQEDQQATQYYEQAVALLTEVNELEELEKAVQNYQQLT